MKILSIFIPLTCFTFLGFFSGATKCLAEVSLEMLIAETDAAVSVDECAAGKIPVREILEVLKCQDGLGPTEAELEELIKKLLVKQLSPLPERLAKLLIDRLWKGDGIDTLLRSLEWLGGVIDLELIQEQIRQIQAAIKDLKRLIREMAAFDCSTLESIRDGLLVYEEGGCITYLDAIVFLIDLEGDVPEESWILIKRLLYLMIKDQAELCGILEQILGFSPCEEWSSEPPAIMNIELFGLQPQ